MGYKMKGSPAKLGGIQGTTGHASALKMATSPAPFLGAVAGAVGKAAGAVSKVAGAGSKIGKAASKVQSGSKKAKDYFAKKKAKKASPAKNKGHKGSSDPNHHLSADQAKKKRIVDMSKKYEDNPSFREYRDKQFGGKTTVKGSVSTTEKDASPAKMYGKKSPAKAKTETKKQSPRMTAAIKKAKDSNFIRTNRSLTKVGKKTMTREEYDIKTSSPAKVALKGKQANLPGDLKAKIKASPGKFWGTAIKIVGKGLMGRAKSRDAKDAAKGKGITDAMSGGVQKF